MNKKIDITEISDYRNLCLSKYVFTTEEWLCFLQSDKKRKPLVLSIKANGKEIIFVSLVFKKMFKMCGSPFEGWNTPYMGFINLDLLNDIEKLNVIKSIVKFLKYKKHCWYIQICDWNIDVEFAKNNKLKYESNQTYFRDISDSEDHLFMEFKNDVRTNHRAFEKNGLRLNIMEPSRSFMDKYYDQLIEVFKKRNLVPHYGLERLHALADAFKDSKRLLLEEVLLPDEDKCIATGIFLMHKKRLYFFGAASYREYQILRPNEEVIWNAIKYAKSQGCTEFDMMGLGKYKEKFRPEIKEIPVLYFQRLPFLHFLKNMMKKRTFKSFKK